MRKKIQPVADTSEDLYSNKSPMVDLEKELQNQLGWKRSLWS